MGKTKKGFWDAWKMSASVEDVLKYKGWKDAHAAGGAVNSDYQNGVETLIEASLPKDGLTKDKATLEKNLRDLQRKRRQGRFGFVNEQIPEQPIEELISLIGGRWPEGLWTVKGTDRVITINDVVASPELYSEEALKFFGDRADETKATWDDATMELAVFVNLMARIEGLPPPTEDQVDAFYSSREWAHASAIAKDRDGLCCVECGTRDGDVEVHHKTPVRKCWHLRLIQSNFEILCIPCHRKKDQALRRKDAALRKQEGDCRFDRETGEIYEDLTLS